MFHKKYIFICYKSDDNFQEKTQKNLMEENKTIFPSKLFENTYFMKRLEIMKKSKAEKDYSSSLSKGTSSMTQNENWFKTEIQLENAIKMFSEFKDQSIECYDLNKKDRIIKYLQFRSSHMNLILKPLRKFYQTGVIPDKTKDVELRLLQINLLTILEHYENIRHSFKWYSKHVVIRMISVYLLQLLNNDVEIYNDLLFYQNHTTVLKKDVVVWV